MSLWLDGVSRSYPPLDRDVTADVAIVGAGIAGVATAYFLASSGVKVVVLEARGVAERGEGKFEAAQRAYEKALAADPNGPSAADALFNLGVLHMDFLKQPGKARARLDEYMKKAAANHPRHADAEARLRELAKSAPAPAQSKGQQPGGSS